MAESTYNKIFNTFMAADAFKAGQAQGEQKGKDINVSKSAKGHFFSLDYLNKYKEAVEKNEEVRSQSFEALDSIDYYNKKYKT